MMRIVLDRITGGGTRIYRPTTGIRANRSGRGEGEIVRAHPHHPHEISLAGAGFLSLRGSLAAANGNTTKTFIPIRKV